MKVKTDPLDTLFSEFIRRRAIQRAGGCERCLTPKIDIEKEDGKIFPAWKQLQCAHYFTRGERATRFDEDNACGLCGGCHIFLDSHPAEKIQFFKKLLGRNKSILLEGRRRDRTKPDRAALGIYLKAKIKEIENG